MATAYAFPTPTVAPEILIACRGGATPGYANDPAKLLACNKWVDHARPIITSMLLLDDEAQAPLIAVRQADPNGYSWAKAKPQTSDCTEALSYVRKACDTLLGMLDGIRDNFIGDECVTCAEEGWQDEADDFNDWLRDNTMTVDAAVKLIADERWEAFVAGKAVRS